MATKREMKAEALALAQQLGVSVDVDRLERMNAAALVQFLAELKAGPIPVGESTVGESAGGQPSNATDVALEGSAVAPSTVEKRDGAVDRPPVVQPALPPAASPTPRRARPVVPPPSSRKDRFVPTRKFLAESASRAPYVVAKGQTLSSTRGLLKAGDGVRLRDFSPELLEELIEIGALIDRRKVEAGEGGTQQ